MRVSVAYMHRRTEASVVLYRRPRVFWVLRCLVMMCALVDLGFESMQEVDWATTFRAVSCGPRGFLTSLSSTARWAFSPKAVLSDSGYDYSSKREIGIVVSWLFWGLFIFLGGRRTLAPQLAIARLCAIYVCLLLRDQRSPYSIKTPRCSGSCSARLPDAER